METKLRTIEVRPITSTDFTVLPIEEYFAYVVQGAYSKIYFVGHLLNKYGYTELTTIDVYAFDLNNFTQGEFSEGMGTAERALAAIKYLHVRNRAKPIEQLKDFGKIIYLLEKYIVRTDRFCPTCSKSVSVRFTDIYKYCPFCKTVLELEPHIPVRHRKKKSYEGASC